MLGFTAKNADAAALVGALDRSLAIISFDPSGNVLSANEKFCRAFGYDAAEIVGQHHRMFVAPEYARSHDYQAFWQKLGTGIPESREYQRIAKGGRPVWIQATYNPVTNARGQVTRIVKLATDITAEKHRKAEADARATAESGVMSIEFTPQGEIVAANSLFLRATGYTIGEIKGRHHRIFVANDHARSEHYAAFWQRLASGHLVAADFQRFGKNGKEIWLQASYNPVFGADGQVLRVHELATDITGRMHAVQTLQAGLAELAADNLTFRITHTLDPHFEKLRTDYNRAASRLHDAVRGIASNTNQIRAAIADISQASDDLSQRTEQQAASLEETAASLQQITSTVRRTAESATSAGLAVAKAREKADASGRVVQNAVSAMSRIEESARKISQIIGVIDEIAFQTNLLALNAGVEAARAGDAGRGFAVVASEVRALAQRSAEAAKEIKTLISASSQQVGRGVELVGETGRALDEITEHVAGVDGIVAAIAAAAKEEATGLAEVNLAVNQMDLVTQQNAAMVEQSNAATQSVAKETESLAALTGQFRIMQDAPAKPAPSPRPRTKRPPLRAVAQNNAASDAWEEF